LDVAQQLVILSKNTGTLAHCYYLAKSSLDAVSTECIQFKAIEVLLTLYKKEPKTFTIVQVDMYQHIENLKEFDYTNEQNIQHIIDFINRKNCFINNVLGIPISAEKGKTLEQTPEELLDSDLNDLLILDMVADCLKCPFTEKVTDDFRVLPCGHKISYLALEKFMKTNYYSLKCFYCNEKFQMQDAKKLQSSPIYKALYKRLNEAGYIAPRDNTIELTTVIESQDDSDSEEVSISIVKSKFLSLLKAKPRKSLMERIIPKALHPTYKQGTKALDDKRYGDAILWLEKALDHYPNSSTIQCDLAIAYEETRDYKKCCEYFNEAIKSNPKNAEAWAYLGNYYLKQTEYQQSLRYLKQSLVIKPNNSFALNRKGEVFRMIKQYSQALIDFNKSLDIEPNDVFALSRRGYVYRKLNRYEDALKDLNKSLEIESTNAFTLRTRGNVYRMLKRYNEALSDLNKSLEIEPNNADTKRIRGDVYRGLDEYDKALNDLNESLKTEPNKAWTLRRRGDVYRMINRYDDALKDLDKSLEIKPNNAFALKARQVVCVKLNTAADPVGRKFRFELNKS
jgi:tetratricopeptide (TPR) repeat protein